MKRSLFVVAAALALGSLSAGAADSSTIQGWISDSMCAAKHAGTNGECAKKCIEQMGSKPVFVDESKKQVWTIDNPDSVKKFYGEHVSISAKADADKKSVHIESISAAK